MTSGTTKHSSAAGLPQWVNVNFEAFERAINGHKSNPIHKVRKQALKLLSEKGLPLTSDEEWKYTNISEISSKNFKLASKTADIGLDQISQFLINGKEGMRLVFVDGRFSAELSNIKADSEILPGLKVSPLSKLFESQSDLSRYFSTINLKSEDFSSQQPVVALNTAFASEGLAFDIDRNVSADKLIQILYISSGNENAVLSTPRVMINAAEGSRISIAETHAVLNDSEYLSSPLTEVNISKNAEVNYYKIGLDSSSAYHLGNILINQVNDSRSNVLLFTLGGKIVRNEVRVKIDGSNSNASISGLTVLDGEQHVDNHTEIDHAMPHSESHEKIKGIYAGKSRGVFNGTIIVRKDAQKTNAYQSNQTVLLSKDANIDTKPQLKIWADDVKCSHGATVGQLDENALFYLRSRGIDKNTARNLLVHAFASEIFTELKDQDLKNFLESRLTAKLEAIDSN